MDMFRDEPPYHGNLPIKVALRIIEMQIDAPRPGFCLHIGGAGGGDGTDPTSFV